MFCRNRMAHINQFVHECKYGSADGLAIDQHILHICPRPENPSKQFRVKCFASGRGVLHREFDINLCFHHTGGCLESAVKNHVGN